MSKRIKLADRELPTYSKGEEIFNMVSHIVGGALGIAALVLCIITAAKAHSAIGVISSCIYGFTLIALYTMSSVYHGLKPGMAKKSYAGFRPLHHLFPYCRKLHTYTFSCHDA